MHTDEEKIDIDGEESVFGADPLIDDVFDDGDHPLEDDEISATHDDDEEPDLFDFYDEDKRDVMY